MKKLNSDAERKALTQTVHDAYVEIFPTDTIEERLDALPPESYVAVTCSPTKGVEVTLDMSITAGATVRWLRSRKRRSASLVAG